MTPKHRIVFFNSSMSMGGPARVASMWGNYFISQGYEVEMVSNVKSLELFYDFNPNIMHSILGIDEFYQKNKFTTLYKIWLFLKNRNNQILIFNKALYINYLFILKIFGLIDRSLRLVYFAHGGSSDFKSVYSNFKVFLIHFTFSNIISLYDDYDSYSECKSSKRKKIIDKIFPSLWSSISSKILYIPNPTSFRVDGCCDYSKKTVVAIGRLDYIKGFDLLIDAWVVFAKTNKDWKLNIIGDGEQKDVLLQKIKDYGLEDSVSMLGAKKDVKRFLLESSIFAMSSREEGMPMVLLEAMECGLPIVAFDNAGAKLLVDHLQNGLICKVGDVVAFARNMGVLSDSIDIRINYGQVSRNNVKKFHIENLIQNWNPVLKDNDE